MAPKAIAAMETDEQKPSLAAIVVVLVSELVVVLVSELGVVVLVSELGLGQ